MDDKVARIVIHRPKVRRRDILRRYKVEVDGVVRGLIGRGDRLEVDVTPGRHVVRAAIDWTGSPPVTVDARGGGSTVVRVEPGGNAFAALLQMWQRDSYIRLTVEQTQ